ncbi:hypothetical protein ACIP98_01770 [Streptomyces sp. NPDC088354]|uniref:hypothetical protein n=1 Tax=Streptomyces sp. NPDC088354 TaxID=3365856 RepID=UPI0038149630
MRTVLWTLAGLFFGALAVSSLVEIVTGFRSGFGDVVIGAGHLILSGLAVGHAIGKAWKGHAAPNR